eukprot:m.694614 g.694614  ORF g.694614 m.694614 type:complete len:1166 (-) comp22883_c1_seq1:215-3712(-)
MFEVSGRTMDPLENTWSVSRSPLPIEPGVGSDSDGSMNFTATLQNRRTRLEGTPQRTNKSNFVPQVESCVVKRTSPGTPWGIQIKGRGAGMSRWIEVSDVVDGSLSYTSGVHIGDSVVSIDSISLAGCRFEEVRELFYSGKTIVVERPLAEVDSHGDQISDTSSSEQNVTGCDLTATFGAAETQKRADAIARGEREVVIVRRFTSVQLGMVVGSSGNHAVVTRVKPDGPADLAGVVAGDRILRIDGMPMKSAAAATDTLRLAGTTVVLSLLQLPEDTQHQGHESSLRQTTEAIPDTKVQTVLSKLNDPIALSVTATTDADSGDEETNELAAMYQRMLAASEHQRHADEDTLQGVAVEDGALHTTRKPHDAKSTVVSSRNPPTSPISGSMYPHNDETPLSDGRDKERPDGPDHADAVGGSNAKHNTTLKRIGRSLFQLDKLDSTRDKSWKKFLGMKDLHRLLPQKLSQRQRQHDGQSPRHSTLPRPSQKKPSSEFSATTTRKGQDVNGGHSDPSEAREDDGNVENDSAELGNSLTPDLSDIDDAFALEGETGDDLLNTLRVVQNMKTAADNEATEDCSRDGYVETVELVKNSTDSGFGLGIRANPWHPYARVSSIIAGGVAENSGGKVRLGDRVLAVDGVDGFGNADSVPLALRNAGTTVCITVERDSSPLFDAVNTRMCRRILRDDQSTTAHPTQIPGPAPDIFRLVRDLRRTLHVDGSEKDFGGGQHFNASVQIEYATMRRAAAQMVRIQRQQVQRAEELLYMERTLTEQKRVLDAREVELHAQQDIVDDALRNGWDELKLQRLAYHRQLARWSSPHKSRSKVEESRPYTTPAEVAGACKRHPPHNADDGAQSDDGATAHDGSGDARTAAEESSIFHLHRTHVGDKSVDTVAEGTQEVHDISAHYAHEHPNTPPDDCCAGDHEGDSSDTHERDHDVAITNVAQGWESDEDAALAAGQDAAIGAGERDGLEEHADDSDADPDTCPYERGMGTDDFSDDAMVYPHDNGLDASQFDIANDDGNANDDMASEHVGVASMQHSAVDGEAREGNASDEEYALDQMVHPEDNTNAASDDERGGRSTDDTEDESLSESDGGDGDGVAYFDQASWDLDQDADAEFSDMEQELTAEDLDARLQHLAAAFAPDPDADMDIPTTDPVSEHGLFTEI